MDKSVMLTIMMMMAMIMMSCNDNYINGDVDDNDKGNNGDDDDNDKGPVKHHRDELPILLDFVRLLLLFRQLSHISGNKYQIHVDLNIYQTVCLFYSFKKNFWVLKLKASMYFWS